MLPKQHLVFEGKCIADDGDAQKARKNNCVVEVFPSIHLVHRIDEKQDRSKSDRCVAQEDLAYGVVGLESVRQVTCRIVSKVAKNAKTSTKPDMNDAIVSLQSFANGLESILRGSVRRGGEA